MSRCEGLSYNAWLYLMPRHVLDDLVERKVLRSCSNHRTKLMMSRPGKDWLESSAILFDAVKLGKEGPDVRQN